MKQRAVFLDRDGTINVEKNYLFRIADFEFLPGVMDSLRLLQENQYLLIIITNQSGIARGYYTEEDFMVLNEWMIEEFAKNGVIIDQVYYCPHHPDAKIKKYRQNCLCRKPKIGLYEEAVRDYDIDLRKSFVIGDKIRDCSICENTACRGYLIAENEKKDIIEAVKNGYYKRVQYKKNITEAVKCIVFDT